MKILFKNIMLLANCLLIANCYAQTDTSFRSNGNPVIAHKFTADPAALVHKDTVYLYTGRDEAPKGEARYVMNHWLCFSTTDMINWREHPSPLNVKSFSWAKGDAWASQVIFRNNKFYWYVAVEHASGGKAIGIAVADHPTGPFKDVLGKAIVTNSMTKATSITWDDIDPTVFIDDDGQAYLFWGNTKCYYSRLKENMIELEGPILVVEGLPNFTEAPWIHKRKDWYYLSYAYQWPEKIAYSMSKNINGPWEFKGILNELAGNSNTNHQSIIQFKKKWYFVYHNGALADHGGFHRSVCIDRLYYNKNGTMKRVLMTSEGLTNQ